MRPVTLRQGSQGPEVKRLQLLLNAALIPPPALALDGDFGPSTADAVLRFQRANGLADDGAVGPETWHQLGQHGRAPDSGRPAATWPTDAPWMEVAALELGVHEDARPGHHTRRILEYHRATSLGAASDEVPWCSSFVNWAMLQVGIPGTNNALARSWLRWGRALPAARAGAISVLKRKGATSDAATGSSTGYHVAFFVSETPTHVRLLGGNQRDAVRYSEYPITSYSVEGYRWPA